MPNPGKKGQTACNHVGHEEHEGKTKAQGCLDAVNRSPGKRGARTRGTRRKHKSPGALRLPGLRNATGSGIFRKIKPLLLSASFPSCSSCPSWFTLFRNLFRYRIRARVAF